MNQHRVFCSHVSSIVSCLVVLLWGSPGLAQLSSNSGINADDTYVIFDMAVNTQGTYVSSNGSLYDASSNTSTTTLNIAQPQPSFHVEEGYDNGGQVVLNIFPTPTLGPAARIHIASGQISLFDQNGTPIILPTLTSAPPLTFQTPGNRPGPIAGLAVPNVQYHAQEMSAQITSGPTQGSPSYTTLNRTTADGGTSSSTYQSSSNGWTLNQQTFTPHLTNGTWSRVATFSNVTWHANAANDAARASGRISQAASTASATSPSGQIAFPQSASTMLSYGGGGRNIVFQHGFFSDAGTWSRMVPWIDSDFFLGNELVPTLDWSAGLADQGNALVGQIQSAGGDHYILVGHSQGGLIARSAAQNLQSSSPSSLSGVITVDTPNRGALLATVAYDAVFTLVQDLANRIWQATGCGSAGDNVGCFIAYTTALAAPVVADVSLGLAVPASFDLRASSPFLTNLNAQPEAFTRVGIIGKTSSHFILERLAADTINSKLNGLPSDALGGRSVALYSLLFYSYALGEDLFFLGLSFYDCGPDGDYNDCINDEASIDFYTNIINAMDRADSTWNKMVAPPGDSSDGIVNSGSQEYSGAVNYPIDDADSHTAATKSDLVRAALDQSLERQFFVPQRACSYSITVSNIDFSPSGATGTFNVETAAGCSWSVVSSVPWLTIISGGTGTGSGTVAFSIDPNVSVSRSVTLNIGGQNVVINQAAGVAAWWPAIQSLLD